VFAIDLHSHTRFFHGRPELGATYDPYGFKMLAWAAKRRGLHGLATTNHDYYREFDAPDDFVVIPGIEVTTTRGHVLIVGPDPPERTEPKTLTPAEAVDLAHDRDCAAIIAHPYRNSTVRDVDAPFDAIEINGKHPRTRPWVEHLARGHDLPMTGGSDAHYPLVVGRAFTTVDADTLTPESVVEAIRDGRVEAQVGHGFPNGILRPAYRRIHEWKGYLDKPDWITPGVGTPPGERENKP
jgi:predicted metal-dependent phosphoesterase TrpH